MMPQGLNKLRRLLFAHCGFYRPSALAYQAYLLAQYRYIYLVFLLQMVAERPHISLDILKDRA
jgi:hypothetical protein